MTEAAACYAAEMAEMRRTGRLYKLPIMRGIVVSTLWNVGDRTAIGFIQRQPPSTYVVDYYENAGEEVEHYVAKLWELAKERGHSYNGKHYLCCQADPKAYERRLRELWISLDSVILEHEVALWTGIEALRTALARLWIDPERCPGLVEALDNYRPGDDKHAHAVEMLRQGAQIGLFGKEAQVVESDEQKRRRSRRYRNWRQW